MAESPTLPNPSSKEAVAQRRWASIAQAADYLSVSERTVHGLIAQRRIPSYKLNARVIRVDLNEVDAAFNSPFGGDVA